MSTHKNKKRIPGRTPIIGVCEIMAVMVQMPLLYCNSGLALYFLNMLMGRKVFKFSTLSLNLQSVAVFTNLGLVSLKVSNLGRVSENRNSKMLGFSDRV
jgi:hypothetical protein